MTAKRINAPRKSPTAQYLSDMLDRNQEIGQRELAEKVGFPDRSANSIFSQLKSGRTAFPIKYLEPICRELNEDPAPFLAIAMEEYFSDLSGILERVENVMVLSDEEKELINKHRAKG